jgi:HAD superfamily hydrolase (TIGR01549 family)
MKIDSIIFDFDGVLVDSFDIAFKIHQLSKPTLTKERFEKVWNGNITKAVYEDKVVREINFGDEYHRRFRDLMMDRDTKDVVKELAREHKLFIISSTRDITIIDFLERNSILACFVSILGSTTDNSKVKKFGMLERKHGINLKRSIFVTDTCGDIKEGREAGVGYIIGILGGYQRKESLERGKPDIMANNIREVIKLIDNKRSSKE